LSVIPAETKKGSEAKRKKDIRKVQGKKNIEGAKIAKYLKPGKEKRLRLQNKRAYHAVQKGKVILI